MKCWNFWCLDRSPPFSASAAAIFRSVSRQPTLLMDEVDTIYGGAAKSDNGAEQLRGLLNAGHRKGATVLRCAGNSNDVQEFPVYAAVSLAGLGDLPDTLMSRSVIVRMRRRAPDEYIEPFRRREQEAAGHDLHDRLATWAKTATKRVGMARPVLPPGVEDRPADVWEPLVAVADDAGGTWPKRARVACLDLCKAAEDREASLGLRLLADLRTVFANQQQLFTSKIIDSLILLPECPWFDLRGKELDDRTLARMLRKYGVKSKDVRVPGKKGARKGYAATDLHDVWKRYLPAQTAIGATRATRATSQVRSLKSVADPDLPRATPRHKGNR